MGNYDRLRTIMDELSPDLQQEVIDFAQHLLDNQVMRFDAGKDPNFFICPTCFKVSRQQIECHDHLMMACSAKNIEDCKPLMDESGEFYSRAPRWFVTSLKRLLTAE